MERLALTIGFYDISLKKLTLGPLIRTIIVRKWVFLIKSDPNYVTYIWIPQNLSDETEKITNKKTKEKFIKADVSVWINTMS